MKILHTSDWHLGRSLYGRKRYEEFSAFLDWLTQTIENEKVDALLVAGDVFDTSTPSNRAQELYYRFLCRVAASCCRHVVVIAGNHDSPSFLNAPKELLRALNVYVVGSMTDDPADEVIVLKKNPQITQINADDVEAIVCAVPYLRDKDIRTVEPGETIDDKNRKLVEGLKNHYEAVVAVAETKRNKLRKSAQSADKQIPIIAMGHLFTAGGKTVDGDGVRELYVGSLAHVGEEVFPSSIDYLALGHLHVPQAVGSAEHIRYCGSPIPMGYGEATQEKKVVLVELNLPITQMNVDKNTKKEICENQRNLRITEKTVPCFQELVRIVGSLDDIHAKLEELKTEESSAWLEIEYTGSDIIGNLREMLDEAMADSVMEIRRIRNRRVIDRVINAINEDETLDDLDAGDVFTRCLDAFEVPDEDREELTVSYNEIIKDLMEEDINAE
ncbi:MAG: exonuclease sbcCD subunit D [Zetaproteobacteria bacterium CG12_big_fil_rev_8_21_14_0_65_54_13]|nr:MAG: exonuclease sbcCD subunit D [Zetaproteobacteria bacterium CG12_big_fil_rev_8_21_14_0_65_54_13]PIX55056.1 MAG: exonuclease sbcCD subunit D [Zetaproteobacteria bacterium CG_4_10_14_3_um_filter_54_28]